MKNQALWSPTRKYSLGRYNIFNRKNEFRSGHKRQFHCTIFKYLSNPLHTHNLLFKMSFYVHNYTSNFSILNFVSKGSKCLRWAICCAKNGANNQLFLWSKISLPLTRSLLFCFMLWHEYLLRSSFLLHVLHASMQEKTWMFFNNNNIV